ncbi:MAG TPA: CPBP family intramembrane glutamate endopeptidase, partial [Pseudonocardiaceae bacterium]|nr:CPBP family intramembrane glutamate endopeptidase [Pseudonocardiaceae bacterium]
MDEQPAQERQAQEQQAADPPSWMTYTAPMGPVRDGYNPVLHDRDWEGQLAASTRGPMAWGIAAFFGGYGGFYLLSLVITTVMAGTFTDFDTTPRHSIGPLVLVAFLPNVLLGLVPAIMSWWKGQGPRRDFGIVPTLRDLRVGVTCGLISLGAGIVVNLLLIWLTKATPGSTNPLSNIGTLSG